MTIVLRDSVSAWNASHPTHLKGADGKWAHTAGMPAELVSIAVKVLGGAVTASAKHDGDGKATLGANGRSVDLDDHDLEELRKQVINAQYGDDRHRGADGVYRVVRTTHASGGGVQSDILVSLRPVEGAYISETGKKFSNPDDGPDDEEHYNAEFDMVVGEGDEGEFGDYPSTRVSLKDLDDENRKGIYQSLQRATDARRVDTGNGPTDVFSSRPGAVGLRMKDDDGNATEVEFNAGDVRRVRSALDEVLYGEGEGEADLSVPRDARKIVDTSGGPVDVRFKGRRQGYDEWDGSLTIIPQGGAPWGVAVDGGYIPDFIEAFDLNGATAGILERQAIPGGVSTLAFGESRAREEIPMNRKEVQRCGSCRERLPESLAKSRHARRSRYTGALLCDRCGTSPSPYSSMELFPQRTRIPRSSEVIEYEIMQAAGLCRIDGRLTAIETFDDDAIHEAGHAVVAHRLGIPVDSVRLGEGGHGQTVVRSGDQPSLHVAAAIFAGPLAESRWCPDSPGGEESDEAKLHRLLSTDWFDVRAAAELAEDILTEYGADVEALARLLAERRTLTGAQVDALLNRSDGGYDPLVRCDGCGQMRRASTMTEGADETMLCEVCVDNYAGGNPVGRIPRSAVEQGRIYGPEPTGIPVPGRSYEYRWWLPSNPFSEGCEYRSDRIPVGQWRSARAR